MEDAELILLTPQEAKRQIEFAGERLKKHARNEQDRSEYGLESDLMRYLRCGLVKDV